MFYNLNKPTFSENNDLHFKKGLIKLSCFNGSR